MVKHAKRENRVRSLSTVATATLKYYLTTIFLFRQRFIYSSVVNIYCSAVKTIFWQTANAAIYCCFWPIIKQLNALTLPLFSLSLFAFVFSYYYTHFFGCRIACYIFPVVFQWVVSFMRTISFQQCGKYNKYWITKTEGEWVCWKTAYIKYHSNFVCRNFKRIVRYLFTM